MDDRDYDYEFGDDMTVVSSHCSRFTRRHDFSSFSMGDYSSCENCSHMSADGSCILKEDRKITGFE